MRLTLRTLLAYLDDILEPAQAKEIGEKIHESAFAASLVSKIKDVVRRRRIGAPDVSGPGSGPDANVVAEYLDNTLPVDSVADFERICLESDVHLAEVAACHQVLTLVLGDAVEIPAEMREHMYALGAVAPPTVLSSGNGTAGHVLKVAGVGASRGQGSPARATDLAEGQPAQSGRKSDWKRAVPYVVGALILAGWGYIMVTDYVTPDGSVGQAVVQTGSAAHDVELPDEEGRVFDEPGLPTAVGERLPFDSETATNSPAADDPIMVEIHSGPLPAGDVPPAAWDVETPAGDAIVSLPPDEENPDALAADGGSLSPGDAVAAASITDVVPDPAAFEPPPPPIEPQRPLLPPMDVQYTNKEGILVHHDPSGGQWTVMPRRALVFAGEEIASPEPFDSQLTVSDQKLVYEIALSGGTRIRLLEATPDSRFGLEVDRGQVLLGRRGNEPTGELPPLRLKIRGDEWMCDLTEPGTLLGIEVIPQAPTGVGDLVAGTRYAGGLHLVSGVARLTNLTTRQIVELRPEQGGLRFSAASQTLPPEPEPSTSPPDWLQAADSPTNIARHFATKYEKEFLADQPISFSVRPVVKDRQPRMSELATETLALTGHLDGLLDALNAPHEESRIAAIEGLRLWLPRDPQHGEQLKSELQNRYREDAAAIIDRLLWGYSAKDARDPFTSEELVGWMSHDEIAIRELAAYQVQQLTTRTLGYRADRRADEREAILERWREHLDKTGGALME